MQRLASREIERAGNIPSGGAGDRVRFFPTKGGGGVRDGREGKRGKSQWNGGRKRRGPRLPSPIPSCAGRLPRFPGLGIRASIVTALG